MNVPDSVRPFPPSNRRNSARTEASLGAALAVFFSAITTFAEPDSSKGLNLAPAPRQQPAFSLGDALSKPFSTNPFASTQPLQTTKDSAAKSLPPKGNPSDSEELSPIDGVLLKALPDFKDVERSPSLVEHQEIRFAETNATAQARRDLLARIRFREMKHIALRDPELAELDKHVRAATTDRALRNALANYNERLYGLIRKLDPSLTPLIEERKAASFKGTGIQARD
jgi:hypothetical protein